MHESGISRNLVGRWLKAGMKHIMEWLKLAAMLSLTSMIIGIDEISLALFDGLVGHVILKRIELLPSL
jgi:hypothetical protein